MFVKYVVGITGLRGAGKSTVAKAICGSLSSAQIVTMSTLIRAELNELGIEPTDENLVIHTQTMRVGNLEYWMSKTLEMIARLEARVVIIDGLRNPIGDVVCLRRNMEGHALVLGLTADEDALVEHALGRAREGNPVTPEEMLTNIRADSFSGSQWGSDIPGCIELADYTLDANQAIEQVVAQALSILSDRIPRLD